MKLTKSQLTRIIQEELQKVLNEDEFRRPRGPLALSRARALTTAVLDAGPATAAVESQKRSAKQRAVDAEIQQKRNKAKQERLMARARQIAEENPGISFDQAVERARGSVEVARNDPRFTAAHVAAAPCPQGQKQIGQRNDGSVVCG
jgi:hypothetical protein